jgi:ribonuclease T2
MIVSTLLVAGIGADTASAEVPLTGYFIARDTCPAFQSFRRQTNPGDARTEFARAYDLHSQNADAATHYLIEFPGARPSRRWVAVACGQHVVLADESPPQQGGGGSGGGGSSGGSPGDDAESYVLAISWQPGFCETKPQKAECVAMTADRFDATNFALHGLWPQPRDNVYCDIEPTQIRLDKARRWHDLEMLDLSGETRGSLERVMPGSQSALHRHEWVKHGSCYEDGSPERYFADSLALMEALNASAVQDLFENNIGQAIDTDTIRDAFSAAFGPGAGDRVVVACQQDGGRKLITELQLHLHGAISDNPDLGELLQAASPARSRCDTGIVDPAGFQ